MNKTIICNIPMKMDVIRKKYETHDLSLPTSQREVFYPVNAFLEQAVQAGDNLNVIMLLKDDGGEYFNRNADLFREEISTILQDKRVIITFDQVVSPYSEDSIVHENLLTEIVDRIDVDSHIICDITYGPKDLPIVVFCALTFAEKHLRCEVDNIIYGQGYFKDNRLSRTVLCDLSPLYYLNSIAGVVNCNDPQRAKELLKETVLL